MQLPRNDHGLVGTHSLRQATPGAAARCVLPAALVMVALAQSCAPRPVQKQPEFLGMVGPIEYASAIRIEDWLHHSVLGDPSFDSFVRPPGNPIYRGAPPFEWPVKGSFFNDPVGGGWYVYIGDYAKGYWGGPSRCIVCRSMDKGSTWEKLGAVLPDDPGAFDGDGTHGGSRAGASVVYDDTDKRYHMVYDWAKPDGSDSGIAHAVAEKPEGPFRRDKDAILRQKGQEKLLGKYNRPYAPSLLKREKDWLVLGMMDAQPYGWAMFAITAPRPEGPWSKPVIVRSPEGDYFHPPLVECLPAFTRQENPGGRTIVFAPATSVALNRDFQALLAAPLEQAHEPSAWSVSQSGSIWHSQDVENEAAGIWGQTFSGWIDDAGVLHAMFPSRDPGGMGTINIASRPWDKPANPDGFYLSGHEGQALTLLRQGFEQYKLTLTLRLNGRARLLWDYTAALGPDKATGGATIHPASLTRYAGLEMSGQAWSVVRVDGAGQVTTLASGPKPTKLPAVETGQIWNVELRHRGGGESVWISGIKVWSQGSVDPEPPPTASGDDGSDSGSGPATQAAYQEIARPQSATNPTSTPVAPISDSGAVGLLAGANSHAYVTRFRVRGIPRPQELAYLCTEALIGAAEAPGNWFEVRSGNFRYGIGAVSKTEGASAKWCVSGRRFSLYSPKGPDYGTVEVKLDGSTVTTIDLHADRMQKSAPVWTADVDKGYHAIMVKATTGLLPLDCLGATDGTGSAISPLP